MLNKQKPRVYTSKSYMRQFLSGELYVLARKHEHFCSDFMWQIHLLKLGCQVFLWHIRFN